MGSVLVASKTKPKIKNIPTSFEAAVAHHRAGRTAQAEATYRSVLATQPNHEQAAFLLGALCLEGRRPKEAVEWLGRANELAPNNPQYLSNLGEAHRRLGDPRQAADILVRAVAMRPDL